MNICFSSVTSTGLLTLRARRVIFSSFLVNFLFGSVSSTKLAICQFLSARKIYRIARMTSA